MSKIQEFQRAHCLDPDGVIGKITLGKMQEVFCIGSKEQLAHFIGQLAHESGNFIRGRENLNYSAKGLLQTFSRYFTPQQAAQYARKPIMIGNRVYANRMHNGDEATGDGFHFRGAGPLQLTGKRNITAFAKYVNNFKIIQNPDLIVSEYYFESALFFFNTNKLWKYCNTVNHASILTVSRAINLGNPNSNEMPNNLEDRIDQTEKYYAMLCK